MRLLAEIVLVFHFLARNFIIGSRLLLSPLVSPGLFYDVSICAIFLDSFSSEFLFIDFWVDHTLSTMLFFTHDSLSSSVILVKR